MLDPEERFTQWQELTERTTKLMFDVEDLRDFVYARYGQEADIDTPFINELFTMLKGLCDFMGNHLKDLDKAYKIFDTERANLANNFEAWRTGLCPKLIRKVPCISYDEVAKFKVQESASYQDTKQAISKWRETVNY